jgi:hypothetical protein
MESYSCFLTEHLMLDGFVELDCRDVVKLTRFAILHEAVGEETAAGPYKTYFFVGENSKWKWPLLSVFCFKALCLPQF